MYQVVDVERVNLTRIQSSEGIAYALEQQQQLLLVISSDRLARSATLGTLTAVRRLRWS